MYIKIIHKYMHIQIRCLMCKLTFFNIFITLDSMNYISKYIKKIQIKIFDFYIKYTEYFT